ncbi:MAG TPA: hypothetical protein VM029_05210 [Opitutaceae bacterium]|nr:hypothetical protein [Opitutaceae bacterium]
MNEPELFTVTLHHLAPEAKQAGRTFPDLERTKVGAPELRRLVDALAVIAPNCEYAVSPELRITGARGKFIVQVKNCQVQVTSWSVKTGGGALTPAEIFNFITGAESPTEEPVCAAPAIAPGEEQKQNRSRRGAVVLLVMSIIAANTVTAWMALRPPAGLPDQIMPAYRLIDPDFGRRVLADFAGIYETGGNVGDRELTLFADGRVKWVRFGPGRSPEESQMVTAQPADSRGKSVLVTENGGMIEQKDALSVIYFGDTYRRK